MTHQTKARFTIKTKLTLATLLPLCVAVAWVFVAGMFIVNAKVTGQAQAKVKNDLNVAREAYQNEITRIYDTVRFTAAFGRTAETIARHDSQGVADILEPVRHNERLDILAAVNAQGKVLYRANNPGVAGDDQRQSLLVSRALKGEMASGTTVLPARELALEGAELLRQAQIELHATPRAAPPSSSTQNAGMFLMVAAPVKDRFGTVTGAIYGGVLLNNNNQLVDKIKGIVYENAQFRGKEVGNATIFLGDVRIATNVANADGTRAIGTKLSSEVYQKVVLAGQRWIGRAFVVRDWHLTAYEPILSLQQVPIGALYVGMLESPYTAMKAELAALLGFVLLVSAVIGVVVSGYLGRQLARPINELALLARRVTAGERKVQSGIKSRDEIGELAANFNEMSSSLSDREDRINELNRSLEQKVERRTAQLEEKNRLLLQTREELVRVEKLAAIGELAAGVAHEINNPMAIIRGNTELLQLAVPEDDPSREEVETIMQQVKRVERIVENLLKFARREQKELGPVDLNRLLHVILEQIGHQVPLAGVEVIESYTGESAVVEGDGYQLRQVFTNLVLNAVQAMPQGGVVTVATRPLPEENQFEVRVSDTGVGIASEQIRQVFNPFYTTKAEGTGLGLSVSYGIVKEHGGRIDLESTPGVGTSFSVILPR